MILDILPLLRSYKWLLGSSSPRRAEILASLGLSFDTASPSFAEDLPKEAFPTPEAYVLATAHGKADALEADGATTGYDVVVVADSVVVLEGAVLEKPADADDAVRMLTALSGRTHYVHTAVVIVPAGRPRIELAASTHVTFADLPDELIAAYVASGEPLDKAGAYGIQGLGGTLVAAMDGDYFTAMGLPKHALCAALRDLAPLLPQPQLPQLPAAAVAGVWRRVVNYEPRDDVADATARDGSVVVWIQAPDGLFIDARSVASEPYGIRGFAGSVELGEPSRDGAFRLTWHRELDTAPAACPTGIDSATCRWAGSDVLLEEGDGYLEVWHRVATWGPDASASRSADGAIALTAGTASATASAADDGAARIVLNLDDVCLETGL
ncbi:septum formation protein Maf [Thecamonas trahens ATCC 50062]|uniref:Septum formation protein Maf n=1 Tax=Thecamonas trahens ATCC 50062 TaxID=461836 RepID=A0A0L0DML7_THETB|nr:septum formation protein Maf [Thecamonas trahens ATCC 50062]KNC53515.1 septum formation protein Maf [Thecamonas trahens ATCC 50062]|eukprot:XP_013761836.1 septum formation protein Maf [Thecamonas trahens ATCC 50062]